MEDLARAGVPLHRLGMRAQGGPCAAAASRVPGNRPPPRPPQQLNGFEHLPSRERICRTLRKLTKSRTDIRKLWQAVLERNANSADLEQAVTSTSVSDVWSELLGRGMVGYGGPEDGEEEPDMPMSEGDDSGGHVPVPAPARYVAPPRQQPRAVYAEDDEEEEEEDEEEDDDDDSNLSADPRWGSRAAPKGRGTARGGARGRGRGAARGRKPAARGRAVQRGGSGEFSPAAAPAPTTARARAMHAAQAARAEQTPTQQTEPRSKRRRTSLDQGYGYDQQPDPYGSRADYGRQQQGGYGTDEYYGGGRERVRGAGRVDSPAYYPDQHSPYYPVSHHSYGYDDASPAGYPMHHKSPDPGVDAYPYNPLKPQGALQQASQSHHQRHDHAVVAGGSNEPMPHWRWVGEEEDMDDVILPWQDDGIETNNHELSSNDVVLCTHLLESFARRGYLLQAYVDGGWVDGITHWRLAPRKDLAHRPLQGKRRNPVLLTYPPAGYALGPSDQFQSPAPYPSQGTPAQFQPPAQTAGYPSDQRMPTTGSTGFGYQEQFHAQSAQQFHEATLYNSDAPTPASVHQQSGQDNRDAGGDGRWEGADNFLQSQNILSPYDAGGGHADQSVGQAWNRAPSEGLGNPPSAAPPASHLHNMFGGSGAGGASAADVFASIASPNSGIPDL